MKIGWQGNRRRQGLVLRQFIHAQFPGKLGQRLMLGRRDEPFFLKQVQRSLKFCKVHEDPALPKHPLKCEIGGRVFHSNRLSIPLMYTAWYHKNKAEGNHL